MSRAYLNLGVSPEITPLAMLRIAISRLHPDTLAVRGTVRDRPEGTVNPNLATGEIEVLAKSVEVLNTSVTPPFSIEDGIETDETVVVAMEVEVPFRAGRA